MAWMWGAGSAKLGEIAEQPEDRRLRCCACGKDLPAPSLAIDPDSLPDPNDPLLRSKREQQPPPLRTLPPALPQFLRDGERQALAAKVSSAITRLDALRAELVELKRVLA